MPAKRMPMLVIQSNLSPKSTTPMNTVEARERTDYMTPTIESWFFS